jgi:alkyl sulfatase BDS1-like metallo-beta-lactamase superfamily hydrolase
MAISAERPRPGSERALKLHDSIHQAPGFCNTMMVTTSEGNVIIDTSWPRPARRHRALLKAVNSGPVKYILLTHGHSDHTGGIPLWQEPETKIIANRLIIEFRHYQARLNRFLATRNAAQFGYSPQDLSKPWPWPGNFGARAFREAIYFDDHYSFQLGGLTFELHHTPGETPDHSTVWIPEFRAAFTGDNYYESFPNIYTLRGTRPRSALDYVESLDKVIALEPEIVIPSHGRALYGREHINERLTRYRDAILYVHDAVVKGMNEGLDVFRLMREIRLPKSLEEKEVYGKVAWSVRGIYEGYAGWFDLNPSSLYEESVSAIYPDVVELAGGIGSVLRMANMRLQSGRLLAALRLTEVALGAEPSNREALETRLQVLRALLSECKNTNESGWLGHGIREVEKLLVPRPDAN